MRLMQNGACSDLNRLTSLDKTLKKSYYPICIIV
jgi:hypothetical protein